MPLGDVKPTEPKLSGVRLCICVAYSRAAPRHTGTADDPVLNEGAVAEVSSFQRGLKRLFDLRLVFGVCRGTIDDLLGGNLTDFLGQVSLGLHTSNIEGHWAIGSELFHARTAS
jgi:hypothetical protein